MRVFYKNTWADAIHQTQPKRSSLWLTVVSLLLFVSTLQRTYAQNQTCSSAAPSVLAKFDFNSTTVQCNGAYQYPRFSEGVGTKGNSPVLYQDQYTFCPTTNSGCGQAILGSKGHRNTPNFGYALCLSNFYNPKTGSAPYDPPSTVWNPTAPANIYITYTIPAGKKGCLTAFALKILQKQYNGSTVNFEKQGVAVYRNGVQIYSTTQTILASNVNATPMTFTFPSTADFCSDGNTAAKFTIYFGLVHRLVDPVSSRAWESPIATGYDDMCVIGTCGGSPTPVASATSPTCGASGALSNGSITLANFATGDKYDFTAGSTYSGSQTYATATAVPANGIITTTLPNPSSDQVYTVRVFNATCYQDVQTTLKPTYCPVPCVQPTAATLTPLKATCTGNTVNSNAQIQISGVAGGDKVGISTGSVYTGAAYSAAQTLTSGAYNFTGLTNPTGSQTYTIRIFNGSNDCYIDRTVELLEAGCLPCSNLKITVLGSGNGSIETNSTNNSVIIQTCKSNNYIDLKLAKTVSPSTGATCPTATDFVWTLTLTNEGTMTATNIQVADFMSDSLLLVSANPSIGAFGSSVGWLLDSLQAGQSTTLTLTTKATVAGTYKNRAWVQSAFPLNDPDSTPGNEVTTEDDYAEASITVTGGNVPSITKEFSPMLTAPNVPTRMTITITNTATVPITLTANLVDTFPTGMVVASTPKLSSSGITLPGGGIIATANSGSLTIPQGTVLAPGLNQVFVDVTVPSNGDYCNTIPVGALKTTTCENIVAAEACISANSAFQIAPVITKSMSPTTIQTGQNATLTITIENKNASVMTLNQDFFDYLPTGLVATSAPTSSCGSLTTTAENSNTEIKIASGSTIPANTICTITVPVTSNTVGYYCNTIGMNALLTTVGTNNNLGNEDFAQACMTVISTPCTVIDITAINPSLPSPITPGSAVALSPTITGAGAKTIYQWSALPTTANVYYSNTGQSSTTWTPTVMGNYTLKLVADNTLTGYGACKDSLTISICVSPSITNPSAAQALCTATTGNNITIETTTNTANSIRFVKFTSDQMAGSSPTAGEETAIYAGTAIATVTPTGASNPYTATYTWNSVDFPNATNSPITYYVYAILNPDLGANCRPIQEIQITVNPTPSVTKPANQTLCAGASTTAITFSGAVTGTTYSWTNNTTSIGLAASGTGNIAAFTATNATSAPVTATITVTPTANGCTGTAQTFTITVYPTITSMVSVVSGGTIVCTGASVSLSANVTNLTPDCTIQWQSGDGTTFTDISGATGTIYTATNLSASVHYRVRINCTTNPCANFSAPLPIIVNSNPNASISGNNSVCLGGVTTLDAGSYSSYLWSTNATTQTITVGIGTYTVTVTNINGCKDTNSITVSNYPIPNTPSLPSSVMNPCPTTTVNLTNISAALTPSLSGSSFEWHVSNSTSSALVNNPTAVGEGIYYLFEKSSANCYSSGTSLPVQIQTCCPSPICIPVIIIRNR